MPRSPWSCARSQCLQLPPPTKRHCCFLGTLVVFCQCLKSRLSHQQGPRRVFLSQEGFPSESRAGVVWDQLPPQGGCRAGEACRFGVIWVCESVIATPVSAPRAEPLVLPFRPECDPARAGGGQPLPHRARSGGPVKRSLSSPGQSARKFHSRSSVIWPVHAETDPSSHHCPGGCPCTCNCHCNVHG